MRVDPPWLRNGAGRSFIPTAPGRRRFAPPANSVRFAPWGLSAPTTTMLFDQGEMMAAEERRREFTPGLYGGITHTDFASTNPGATREN
jgi:hypothetical protein